MYSPCPPVSEFYKPGRYYIAWTRVPHGLLFLPPPRSCHPPTVFPVTDVRAFAEAPSREYISRFYLFTVRLMEICLASSFWFSAVRDRMPVSSFCFPTLTGRRWLEPKPSHGLAGA